MTDETTSDHRGTPVTVEPIDEADVAAPAHEVIRLLLDPPRAGELTLRWRIVMFVTWTAVIIALASVWSVSVQLGLSTWWLGPRGAPQPLVVQLSPFLAPIVMLLGAINNITRLGRLGIGAALVTAAVAVPDLGKVTSLAVLELAIAAAAGAVSIASLTGTYRRSDITPDARAD